MTAQQHRPHVEVWLRRALVAPTPGVAARAVRMRGAGGVGAASRASTARSVLARPQANASAWRASNVTEAIVAQWREADMPVEYAIWLWQTFSLRGLTELSRRGIRADDVTVLQALAARNVSRLRGYVSKTRLPIADVAWLMERDVSCTATVTWSLRLSWADATTNLTDVLKAAQVVHSVPEEHLAGWVRYANEFEVAFDGTAGSWQFLGGPTALMVHAGISPREARRWTRQDAIDLSSLRMLAALRAGQSGAR